MSHCRKRRTFLYKLWKCTWISFFIFWWVHKRLLYKKLQFQSFPEISQPLWYVSKLKSCSWFAMSEKMSPLQIYDFMVIGERGGSVVEYRTPEREVRGSRPTAAVLCPWARHFTPRKYWLITQEAMAPSRHDWKIVDWDVKPQHNHNNKLWW